MQTPATSRLIAHPFAAALAAAACAALIVGGMAGLAAIGGGSAAAAAVAMAVGGIAAAAVGGAIFALQARNQTRRLTLLATRIADLAAICGHGEESTSSDDRATVAIDPARLDGDITAIRRAYRNLVRERGQSNARLEEQIARQSQFYARLSHELRSPLNAILGYASLLIEDAETGEIEDLPQDLRKIRGAGHTLLALIDNLLQLAEDRTGRETVSRAPFVLREALAQVVADHGQAAVGTRIELQDAAGRETLFGNRAKVVRAIGSLVDDAVRSRQAEELIISTRPSPTNESCVEVVVEASRDGAGSHENDTLTRHLADRLAEAVSGNLDVTVVREGRWTYTLRLPHDVDARPGQSAVRTVPLSLVPQSEAAPGERSALVIDDDAATIDLMGRWLERCGYRVRSALNAEQGLAIAREMRPDIILLDALMPGRTGYDVLPDLSALPLLRDTPILLVTVDDDRSRGLAAGAADYVRKPITESRLRDIISVYEKDLDGEVLIIEDDPAAAEVMERTVRRLGLTVRLAADGVEGLAALEERRPSAILLDLNMPNLNGFEFIERLVHSADFGAIPLIVLSGQELSVAQHHRLLSSGCRYYMKGNAAPREIAETLREMVA